MTQYETVKADPVPTSRRSESQLSQQEKMGGGELCGFECGREKSALDDEIQSRQIQPSSFSIPFDVGSGEGRGEGGKCDQGSANQSRAG